jgi:hypothetical protein
MLHTQRLTKSVAAAGSLAPVVLCRPQVTLCRPRHACIARVSSSTPGSITHEEAERFEKIAAALVEKLKDLPDTELEPEGKCRPGVSTKWTEQQWPLAQCGSYTVAACGVLC